MAASLVVTSSVWQVAVTPAGGDGRRRSRVRDVPLNLRSAMRRRYVIIGVVAFVALAVIVVVDRITAPPLVGGCRVEPGATCEFDRIDGADVSGADWSELELYRGAFTNSVAVGTVFRDAQMVQARIVRSDLTNADLRGATLYGAYLTDSVLRGADLRDTDLRFADFSGADLSGADLSGAEIDDAIFTDVVFDDTRMPDGSVRSDS